MEYEADLGYEDEREPSGIGVVMPLLYDKSGRKDPSAEPLIEAYRVEHTANLKAASKG